MYRFEDAIRFALQTVEILKQNSGPADIDVQSAMLLLTEILFEAGESVFDPFVVFYLSLQL